MDKGSFFTVGFIGLGQQGRPIALNIAVSGHKLYVYDVDPLAVETLVQVGAVASRSPKELATQCDVVFVCVATDEQVLDVVAGKDGLLSGLSSDTVIVIHSTVAYETIIKISAEAMKLNVSIVDAPVSGGAIGAQQRNLTYIVGGVDSVLARCEPILSLSGSSITHTGPVGTATVVKLAHQIAICSNVIGMAEAIALAGTVGVSASIVQKVISLGVARSLIAEKWTEPFFGPNAGELLVKDLCHAISLAQKNNVTLTGASTGIQAIKDALPNIRFIAPSADHNS